MKSIFDQKKLLGLLKDFYEITRIRITVFDENLTELLAYPTALPPYCRHIRKTIKGFNSCMECDRSACETASKRHGTYIYRCHAGLTEAVRPIYLGDVVIGYLFFGHVFSYEDHEEGWETIHRCCKDLKINEELLKSQIFETTPITEDYVRSAAHILHAVASYLILERMASIKEDVLGARLDAYLHAHFTEKMDALTISAALGIGKTQLYELSHQLYGRGTAEVVRELRMEKAKELLRSNKTMTLSEVSSLCGYPDYNYFFTVFRRCVGCTPREWRSDHLGASPK